MPQTIKEVKNMSSACQSCKESSSCDGTKCTIEKEKGHELSNVKNIIAIMSGKGGVGKSSVTSLLAVYLREKGYKVGILDADITGPSIPKIFGIGEKRALRTEFAFLPVESTTGIRIMSLNLLVENEEDPVIWRGPVIAGVVKQFWTDVAWGELDYLLVDLPPGTGDVPLTVMQSIPVNGIIVVSSPQDLVKMIVKKAKKMADIMEAPLLGLIENMSWIVCPDCGKEFRIFGKNDAAQLSQEMELDLLGQIPLDLEFVDLCDHGRIEVYPQFNEKFSSIVDKVIAKVK